MAAKTVISEEEYLRTSFPGLDQEYRDGELLERSMPDYIHGKTQLKLGAFFLPLEKTHSLYVSSETRHHLRPRRYIISDVSVFWPSEPTSRGTEDRPLAAIEILSEDDRMSDVRDKLQEYVDAGVPHVWLVDPRRKRFYICDASFREVPSFVLPEVELTITPADLFD